MRNTLVQKTMMTISTTIPTKKPAAKKLDVRMTYLAKIVPKNASLNGITLRAESLQRRSKDIVVFQELVWILPKVQMMRSQKVLRQKGVMV